MGDRRRQSQGDVTLLLPPGSAADVPPKELNRRRAASVTAFFLIAICSLLLLLSQSPAVWNTTCEDASNAASFPIQRYNTDQDREAAVLLKYGGGPVAQRTENHSAPSLPPSTNEDRLLQHAAKEGIDITDKVVSVATNLTTPQHKSPQSSSVKSQTSSSMLEGTSEANAQKKGGPIFGTPVPGESHIIFVETSCAFNDTPRNVSYDSESGLRLSPRAACALEAAARTHPDRRVYLLHTCPVRREALEPGRAPAYALAALSLPNARLWQRRYKEFFPGSPLERWLESGALRRSVYPVVHAADVLRFVVLWKYGGTYLDTDVLMLRSLGNTSDFACPESEQQVSVGAMDMTFHDAGRRLAELCLDEERLNYDPNQWGHNGPGAITRAMQKMCKVNKVTEMTPEHCGGYKLLPPSAFYPIHYSHWRRFFKEEGAEQTLAEVRGSIGVHVWNALSHDEPVHTHSKQPYAQLARQVCPSVVAALNGTIYARQSTDQWTGRSPDQTSLIASLLRYGGGTVAQRMENHRASSLSPSTNEDRFLQHESTEGIDITDNVVSAATNITTPQHKYARQSTDQQTSQSPDQTSLIASLLSYGVGTVAQRTENHSASSLSPSTNEDRFLQHTSTKGIDITDNAVSAATNVTTPQHKYARQSTDQQTSQSPDQTSLIASLLSYGVGTVSQRTENHSASSLSPSTNEDRFLQHTSTKGIDITDNAVSAATNVTTPQHNYARQSPDQRTSQSPDQTSLLSSLLSYGVGTVAQRMENHSASSLSPSTNEDRFLQHASTEGIDITDNAVSAATNVTTPQHKTSGSSSVPPQTSSSMPKRVSKASAQKNGGPIFGNPIPGDSHIIFVETSCPFSDTPHNVSYDSESGLRLSPRAACALEAAARTHPDRRVYLLHTCPVRREALEPGRAPAYALAALSLPNARLWQQRYKEFFAGTPLESWLESGALRRSVYPVVHAADVLRFVVLWKYGGTYLDTDVLMLRSLGNTSDFACPESEGVVAIGAMDMSHHKAGRSLAKLCLDEQRDNFNPNQWRHNGPGAITRAMLKMCGVNKFSNMTAENCGGYKLLPASAFYPIYYSRWRRYFQEEGAEQTLAEVRGSIGVHVWNALSHDEPVHTHSKQPYAQLARQVCPSVVAALNGTM